MSAQGCISEVDLARLCDGDLTPEHKRSLELHMDTCRKCKSRWERASSGALRLRLLLSSTHEAQPGANCPPDDALAGYISDSLGPDEQSSVEGHLATCARCRSQVDLTLDLSDSFERDGDEWWDRYVGQQILRLFADVPDEIIGELATAVQATLKASVPSGDVLSLPVLQPVRGSARLAAGTAEGFAEQTLRQEYPSCEFRVTQFGEEVRIMARLLDEVSSSTHCLARLVLAEDGAVRLSRVIVIERGEGGCILKPGEIATVRPERSPLTLSLSPLVTLDDLTRAGAEAYIPVLERLLQHREPRIRRHAVEVVTRIAAPTVHRLIEPLAHDEDAEVRAAACNALRLFSGE